MQLRVSLEALLGQFEAITHNSSVSDFGVFVLKLEFGGKDAQAHKS